MKIEQFYNKNEKKNLWRARFKFNKKEYTQAADMREELTELIDEIRVQERRARRNLPVTAASSPSRTVRKTLSLVEKPHQHTLCKRVFKGFLNLLPPSFFVKEFKKSHFQIYIDWQLEQKNKHNRKNSFKRDTVYKELYALSNAPGKASFTGKSLKTGKNRICRKARIKEIPAGKMPQENYFPDGDLRVLLDTLRQPKKGRQTEYTEFHRRLADAPEFQYETGLRRKEVARLE
jgi:hypothetical protein